MGGAAAHLAEHKRIAHEGVKYKCRFCDYSNSHKGNLRGHLFKKHNEGEVLKCDLCSYTSWKKSLITMHRNVHGHSSNQSLQIHPQKANAHRKKLGTTRKILVIMVFFFKFG